MINANISVRFKFGPHPGGQENDVESGWDFFDIYMI